MTSPCRMQRTLVGFLSRHSFSRFTLELRREQMQRRRCKMIKRKNGMQRWPEARNLGGARLRSHQRKGQALNEDAGGVLETLDWTPTCFRVGDHLLIFWCLVFSSYFLVFSHFLLQSASWEGLQNLSASCSCQNVSKICFIKILSPRSGPRSIATLHLATPSMTVCNMYSDDIQ